MTILIIDLNFENKYGLLRFVVCTIIQKRWIAKKKNTTNV